jgi:hypothetical protein
VNDLKIPGFDVVDEVVDAVEHGDGTEYEPPQSRRRWVSGSAALGLLAVGVTGGMIGLLVLIGLAGGAFGAVAGGCGGG